ncbi:NAD(P)H-binding protein [bacterium]|nr:NAD(P)H-binding protein [bacterium]
MKNILIIGAHGMLGRPVTRHLLNEGYTIRAMARTVEKAKSQLPESVEIVEGDLKEVSSIRSAAEGMDAIYMNLSWTDFNPAFHPDYHGVVNVVQAVRERPDVLLAKISALSIQDTKGDWLDQDMKFKGEQVIKSGENPWLLFRPSWFMDTLSMVMKGKTISKLGKNQPPLYWVAALDYAKTVVAAFRNEKYRNEIVNIQGPESVSMDEVVSRFVAKYDPKMKVRTVPLWLLKLGKPFSPMAKHTERLLYYTMSKAEPMLSQKTWNDLHRPTMKVEDYAEYYKSLK